MGGLDNVPTEALRTAVERLDQYMSDLRWERLSQVNSLLWAADDNALAVQLVLAALNQDGNQRPEVVKMRVQQLRNVLLEALWGR